MDNLSKWHEFKDNGNDDVGYDRHLAIEHCGLRMRAILGLEKDDLQFIKDTYLYSVATLPRPQEKNKMKEDSQALPAVDNQSLQKKAHSEELDHSLQKKTRLEWLRFLKVINRPLSRSSLIPILPFLCFL